MPELESFEGGAKDRKKTMKKKKALDINQIELKIKYEKQQEKEATMREVRDRPEYASWRL